MYCIVLELRSSVLVVSFPGLRPASLEPGNEASVLVTLVLFDIVYVG